MQGFTFPSGGSSEPEEKPDPRGQTSQVPEVKPVGLNRTGLVSTMPGLVAHPRLEKGSWLRLWVQQSPCCDDAIEAAAAVRAQCDPGISFMLPPFLSTKTQWGRCYHYYLGVTVEKPEVLRGKDLMKHTQGHQPGVKSQFLPLRRPCSGGGGVTAGIDGNSGWWQVEAVAPDGRKSGGLWNLHDPFLVQRRPLTPELFLK